MFQSTARVNHMDTDVDVNSADSTITDVSTGEYDHNWMPDHIVDNVDTPTADSMTTDDETSSFDVSDLNDEIILNVMNFTAKNLKRYPSLSVHELDRLRRSGACFRCKGSGHYARNCPTWRQ